jgi:hypothetical protein
MFWNTMLMLLFFISRIPIIFVGAARAVYVSFRAYLFYYAVLASAKCMAVFTVPEAAILYTPVA